MTNTQFPAEEVTLPSKGLLYPDDSPLKEGVIEMKYMTAKEEDILTNANYIKNGVAIDKLLESLIVTPGVKLNDILIGDKNAIMLAARILGYGAEYEVKMIHPETGKEEAGIINLSDVTDKELDESLIIDGKNEFQFTLPTSKRNITFKLLTQLDEKKIKKEVEGLEKINKPSSEGTVTLKHTITSIDGDYDSKNVRKFVDNEMLARDSRAFRKHLDEIQPGIHTKVNVEFNDGYIQSHVELPININFFWPDAAI